MISYILPTRNRPDRLEETLRQLGGLDPARHAPFGGAEIIVVDDASEHPVDAAQWSDCVIPVHVERCAEQRGAAARNVGARAARGDWMIMLDDDSWPLDHGHLDVIAEAPDDLAGFGACITLPSGRREDGGLPEVLVGCGAALRRDAFLGVGGYDRTFHYYAEEYDLAARLLHDGWRLAHDWRFRVFHGKVAEGRDMNRILHRLVRNNGWVVQRYAPDDEREPQLREVVERYGRIAKKERAVFGYQRGLDELLATIDAQPRTPLAPAVWARFTGRAHARDRLQGAGLSSSVAVVDRGKNASEIERALRELNVPVTEDAASAEIVVIGTLSPGPLMDALDRRRPGAQRVVPAWMPDGANVGRGAGAPDGPGRRTREAEIA